MKSQAQRRTEICGARAVKREQRKRDFEIERAKRLVGEVVVDTDALAPSNSYGVPEFVQRGYYVDKPFKCKACGQDQVWTASQQKWWYEVAKGDQKTVAVLCKPCRVADRERRDAARRIHLEGLAKRAQRNS